MSKIGDAEFLRQIVKCASVSDDGKVYIDGQDRVLLRDIAKRIDSRGPLPAGLERLAEVIEEHESGKDSRSEAFDRMTAKAVEPLRQAYFNALSEVRHSDSPRCGTCTWFYRDFCSDWGSCCRFPQWERRLVDDWCGEHSRGAGGRSGASGGGCGSGGCSRASSSS